MTAEIDHETLWAAEKRQVVERWKEAQRTISKALYDEDPEGMCGQ